MNKLTIHAGRKNQSQGNWNNLAELNQYHWGVSEAFAMPRIWASNSEQADIGIAKIPGTPGFFDKTTLFDDFTSRSKEVLYTSRIVPICLARENSKLSGQTLRGAGWGIEYQEARENNPRNPEYSSCMTSELSYRENRFRNCDMEKIKANNWECRTDQPPTRYPATECETLTKTAYDRAFQNKLSNIFSLKKLKKIFTSSIMYVTKPDGTKITCIGPDWTHWKYGWCELKEHSPPYPSTFHRWGVCSRSCSRGLMRVI